MDILTGFIVYNDINDHVSEFMAQQTQQIRFDFIVNYPESHVYINIYI